MAFVEHETWEEAIPSSLTPITCGLNWIERYVRSGASAIIAITVHVGIIWLLVHRFAPEMTARANDPALRVIALMAPVADDKKASSEPIPTVPPSAAAEEEAAQSPPSTAVPEWTMTRIQVPSSGVVLTESAPSAMTPPASLGSNDDVYDPYAGAAPSRQGVAGEPVASEAPKSASAGAPHLDRQAIETLRQKIRSKNPDIRGVITFDVLVAANGIVLDARVVSGTMTPDLAAQVAQMLKSRKLFSGGAGAPRTLRLPALQFG